MNIYTGFHAVEERVKKCLEDKNVSGIKLMYSKPGPRIKKIIDLAKKAKIPVEEVAESDLDKICSNLPNHAKDHRGIVLSSNDEKEKPQNMVELDQWLTACPEKATVIMLDSVTDPHNVGAILRSCDQFGASLMIIPQIRSASDISGNDIIARTSAGASAYVPVAKVANLVRSVQLLKDNGFWIYGADAGGESLQKIKFPERTCIIMGSEGSGMAKLLEEQCDTIVSIPTCGKIDSLNVSVAAGVLLYEKYRQSLQ